MNKELTADHLVDFLLDQLVVHERALSAYKAVLSTLEDGASLTVETSTALLGLDLASDEVISGKVVSGDLEYRLTGDSTVTGYEVQQVERGILRDKVLKRHLLASGLKHWRGVGPNDEDQLMSDDLIAGLKTELRLDGVSDPAEAVVRALFDATADLKIYAQRTADSSSDLMMDLLQQPGMTDPLDKLEQYVSQKQQMSALRLASFALIDAIREGTGHVIDSLEVYNEEIRTDLAELSPGSPDDLRVSLCWLKAARAERRLQRQALNTVLHTLQGCLRDDALVELTIPASSYENLRDRALRLLRTKFGSNAEDAKAGLEATLRQQLGQVPSSLPTDLTELKTLFSGKCQSEDVGDDTIADRQEVPQYDPVSATQLLSWLDDTDDEDRKTVLEDLAAYLSTIQNAAPPIDPKRATGALSSLWTELDNRLNQDERKPRRLSESDAAGSRASGNMRSGSMSSLQSLPGLQRPSSADA